MAGPLPAQQVNQYSVSVPAGTAQASPQTTKLTLPEADVVQVDLQVPPGPSGLMGFYLAYNGQQVIPFQSGQWITWDNHSEEYALDSYPSGGAWQLVQYNTGLYPHLVYLRFHLVFPTPEPAPPILNILNGAPVQGAQSLVLT
jgi:hypothetical protein